MEHGEPFVGPYYQITMPVISFRPGVRDLHLISLGAAPELHLNAEGGAL